MDRQELFDAGGDALVEVGERLATGNPVPLLGDGATFALGEDPLHLLNRRAGLALEVGEIKKHEGSVVFRPEREAQVIDGLKAVNPGPLKSDSVELKWRKEAQAQMLPLAGLTEAVKTLLKTN